MRSLYRELNGDLLGAERAFHAHRLDPQGIQLLPEISETHIRELALSALQGLLGDIQSLSPFITLSIETAPSESILSGEDLWHSPLHILTHVRKNPFEVICFRQNIRRHSQQGLDLEQHFSSLFTEHLADLLGSDQEC